MALFDAADQGPRPDEVAAMEAPVLDPEALDKLWRDTVDKAADSMPISPEASLQRITQGRVISISFAWHGTVTKRSAAVV